MEDFIAYLVKNLVEEPDAVEVTSRQGEEWVNIDIRVAPGDIARVIGRKGRTIQALRTLAVTAAARLGTRVRVDLVEDEKPDAEAAAAAEESAAVEEEK